MTNGDEHTHITCTTRENMADKNKTKENGEGKKIKRGDKLLLKEGGEEANGRDEDGVTLSPTIKNVEG